MKIPDLILPVSGGVVTFIDDDDLTGLDFRRYRATFDTGDETNEGETRNVMYAGAAAVLIASWSIERFPGLPVPAIDSATHTVDPRGLALLPWRDLRAIEVAVRPFAHEALLGIPRPVPEGVDPKE